MVAITFDASTVPPGIESAPVSITFGQHKMTMQWTDRRSMPFSSFGDMLMAPAVGSKDGSCYTPAVFRGPQRRMDLAEQIDVAVLDADCGHTAEEIIEAVEAKGWEAVVHSTYSHGTSQTEVACSAYDKWRHASGRDDPEAYMLEKKGYLPRVVAGAKITGKVDKDYIVEHQPCPKFRVVIPLARPWVAGEYADQTAANAVWKARILALAAALGLHSDQSCTDTSRLFYLPRIKAADQPFVAEHVAGEPCDIWSLPEAPEEQPRQGAARGARTPKASQGHAAAGAAEAAPGTPAEVSARAGEQVDLHAARDTTGRSIDLIKWAAGDGSRFEIVKALKAKEKAKGLDVFGRRLSGVKHHIVCPFNDEHTASDDRTGTYVVNASQIGNAGLPGISNTFSINCMHNSCAGRDRLAFVAMMLEQGTLTVGDLRDKDFLPRRKAVPKRPAELFTVEEVRRRITDAIGAFWVDADRHREVIAGYAEAYEPGKPVRLSLPPLHLLTPTPGTGKTHSAIESLGVGIPAAGAAGQRIWYFVQSHKIAMERVGEFDRTHKGAFKAIAFRGRGATDYDVELPGGGHPELCRRYDVTKALGEAEMSPGHEVCRDCHHRGHADPLLACGYVDQIPTGTDVIFAAYNYMFIPGAQKVFGDVPPYAVIVDENAVPSAIEGGDGERSLNLDDVNKVPIEPLAEYLGKSAAAEFLDKLAPILAAVAKETPIGQRATVPTATLTDAGIEYELVRAAANQLEYEKVEANLPRSTAKTNRDREIIEAVANFAPAVQRRRRQHRLAEIVKATIDAGHGDVPGLRVERREASPGEVHSRVTMAWRRRLADALVNTPVLMLDATADVGQVAAMFGHARIVRHTHLEADLPNSWVRFVQWSASSEKLTPDDGDSEATKGAATNHRRELYELIRYRAWQFRWHVIGLGRRKNCLIVVTKKLYKLISKEFHHQPDNVEIRHHGSLAGSNVFGDYDYILDLSGMRPLPEQLEIQAEALYGRPVHRLGYHQNGRPVWPKPVGGALRRRGEALGEVIDTPRHPDSLVEPFRWRVYEGEKFQVVHRGRPVNRDRLTSLVVETVGNAVPPFEIDEFVESWGENLPSDMEMLRAAGIVPAEGARGRSKAIYRLRRDRPKPWKSEDAAAEWLRANPQPQISLRDKESSPLSFFIEKSGVEGRWPSFRIRVSGDRFAVPYDVDLPTGMVGADRPAGTDEGVSERIRKQLEHHDMKLDQIELAELPFIAVGDRLAELTMPDQIPTRAEAGEFIGEALRFFAMLDARADAEAGRLTLAAGATLPPLPDWWSASPPPRIPPGRRFLVRYRAGDGWISLWHFPDADGGLWADLEMRPVEPPPAVREYAAAQTGG